MVSVNVLNQILTYPQKKFVPPSEIQDNQSDVESVYNDLVFKLGNLALGRIGQGASGFKLNNGFVPPIEWPIPLINIKSLKCSNQNRRFQYPELVPIPRSINRRAFGNYYIVKDDKFYPQLFQFPKKKKLLTLPNKPLTPESLGSLTPFRRAFNAGDPFNRFNVYPSDQIYINKNGLATSISPANQVQGSRRASNQAAASTAGSGRRVQNNGSAYSGNTKWVYDGSDYVRYLKLKAQNNNYNDPSYGGDRYNASQSVLARVRH